MQGYTTFNVYGKYREEYKMCFCDNWWGHALDLASILLVESVLYSDS